MLAFVASWWPFLLLLGSPILLSVGLFLVIGTLAFKMYEQRPPRKTAALVVGALLCVAAPAVGILPFVLWP